MDMGFSFPFIKPKSAATRYFGLYLTDASAYGFIFDTTSTPPSIVAFSSCALSSGFEKILEDVDNLISELELKTSAHLEKTIFFLHSWMIDETTYDIKEPYKNIIKNLCKELELEPLGYIDVQEAVHEHLKKISVVNAIALEINTSKIGVFIYKGGKKVHEQYTARTDRVGEDLHAVFVSLPKELILPANILVYGDTDKAEVSSELATYNWGTDIFPQHPTVDIIKQADLNETFAQVFSTEETAKDTPEASAAAPTPSLSPEPPVDTQSFGFVMGQDVIAEGVPPPVAVTIPAQDTSQSVRPPHLSFFEKLQNMVHFSLPAAPDFKQKRPILVGASVLLSLTILFILYEYFIHTMRITVYVKSQVIDKTIDLDLPVKETQVTDLAVLKHTAVSSVTQQKKVTGSREVGEKATGSVIIHNFDNTERSFTRGTILKKSDLEFTIDGDIKVASASASTVGVKESGKAKVAATASAIGSSYNIEKGTQLEVDSLSSSLFYAIVETAFTGGSKKEVSTVSKTDIAALQSEVEKQAKNDTSDVLGAQTSQDEIILPDLTDVSIADAKFSGEVGEETDSLKVTAESQIDYYTVNKKLLTEKLASAINAGLTDGYSVSADQVDFTVNRVRSKNTTATLVVAASGTAEKEVDIDTIRQAAAHTATAGFPERATKQFEVEKIEISQPRIPILTGWTPFFSKNITVETTIEN